ncbi:MAG: hypothetical protein ACOZAM_22265 [Pseudomonadota bacterium]
MIHGSLDVVRRGYLGREGEVLAVKLLKRKGFKRISRFHYSHAFADIMATRNGKTYVISVKARNKYVKGSNGRKLNPRYKLGKAPKCLDQAQRLAKKYNAIPAWLTIAVDRQSYDAYFGTISQLQSLLVGGRKLSGKGVIMTPEYLKHYLVLAKNRRHNLDYPRFRNDR